MKRVWNEHLDNILRRNYPKGDLDALAQQKTFIDRLTEQMQAPGYQV